MVDVHPLAYDNRYQDFKGTDPITGQLIKFTDEEKTNNITQISYDLLKDQNTFLKNIQRAKYGDYLSAQQLSYITDLKYDIDDNIKKTFFEIDEQFYLAATQGQTWDTQLVLKNVDKLKEKIFKDPSKFNAIYEQFKRVNKIDQTAKFFIELILKQNKYSDIQIEQYFQISENIGAVYENKAQDFFEQSLLLLESFKPGTVYLSEQDLKLVLSDPNTVKEVSKKLTEQNPSIIIVENEKEQSDIIQFSSIKRIKDLLVQYDIPIQNTAFSGSSIVNQDQITGDQSKFHNHYFRDTQLRIETLSRFKLYNELEAYSLAQEFQENLLEKLKTRDLKSIGDSYNKIPGIANSKKNEIKNQIKKYESDLKYLEIVNLVPAIKVFKDIGIQQNPLSGVIYKGIQENSKITGDTKSDLNNSLVQYKEINMHGDGSLYRDNILPQNIKDYIEQQYNDPNLPLNEQQIQDIFSKGKFINYTQFDIKDSSDTIEKTGIKNQELDSNKITAYFQGRTDKAFTYQKYQFAQKVIFDRIQDFFKRSNIQSIEKLVQLYDNLSSQYRKTKDASVLDKVNFTMQNIKKVKEVFSEIFEEAKILISGGGEILSYIKTKVDYDTIKDITKPLFDITNSEAVGSTYAKEFFILADKFWDLKKNGSGNDLKQYFKVIEDSEMFKQFKYNIDQDANSFWGKVSGYYKQFKHFVQSDYANTVMSYFQKFLPLLKDILRITLGVSLPSEAIIMNYAQQALETVQSFMSDQPNSERKLTVMEIEYQKNEILETQKSQVREYFKV